MNQPIRFEDTESEYMTLIFTCTECKKKIPVKVRPTDWRRWQNEMPHVQDCFPYLTPGERELFITGICDACFNLIFQENES